MAENAEETTAEATDDAVKKKGEEVKAGGPNQKLVLIVLVLNAVVLIALAAIVYMGLSKRSKEVTLGDIATQKEEAPKEEHGKEGEGGEHGKKEGGKEGKEGEGEGELALFIKETFVVNLNDPKTSRVAKIDVDIEAENDNVKDEIQKIRPKIRDFILVIISSKSYDQIETPDGKDFLREEIRNKINGYLTRGRVKNVYFTQFVTQ